MTTVKGKRTKKGRAMEEIKTRASTMRSPNTNPRRRARKNTTSPLQKIKGRPRLIPRDREHGNDDKNYFRAKRRLREFETNFETVKVDVKDAKEADVDQTDQPIESPVHWTLTTTTARTGENSSRGGINSGKTRTWEPASASLKEIARTAPEGTHQGTHQGSTALPGPTAPAALPGCTPTPTTARLTTRATCGARSLRTARADSTSTRGAADATTRTLRTAATSVEHKRPLRSSCTTDVSSQTTLSPTMTILKTTNRRQKKKSPSQPDVEHTIRDK